MKLRCQSFWLPYSFCLLCLVTASPLQAQIIRDATLPEPSVVNQNGNTSVITGGTQAGSNLFHSFKEFSVPTGGTASFQQIDQGISNVISRVTDSISNINGLIELRQTNGTVSSANFFLINPNGISFGRNARLLVGGSFIASTASSLKLADGGEFSASNPQTASLLSVNVPVGLQFGRPAGSIQVQGAGLGVLFGKTLGLVGGDLTLVGGILTAAGGRIELGSVAGVTPNLMTVEVSLTPIDRGWALGYEGIQNFRDIQLSQQAAVDNLATSISGGGDIQVQGRQVTLTDNSLIKARTEDSAPGGTLTVAASESVKLGGSSVSDYSGLVTQVGNERISNSVATGAGGNLTIKTRRLVVENGAQVSTSTYGAGKAGDLTVQNATEVELVGGVVETNGDGFRFNPSGLFTQTRENATGAGGNLSISTEKLTVRAGAQVNSTTFGVGRAGDLTVRATDVELVGAALLADGKLLLNNTDLPFPSGLFAGTNIGSTGTGGNLTVETDQLSLRDGAAVQASTLGQGDAGNLTVQAFESVKLIGTAKGSQFPTSLLAGSGGIPRSGLAGAAEATGRGGDLRIETGELIVQNGAAVAVSSLNPEANAKGAGNLDIQAQTVRLDNEGELTSATASGQGGDINLQVQDLLLLRRNSDISSTAGIAGAGGDGGNITIDSPLIVTVPSEDSDITANAFTGRGGRVQITAQGIFGTEYRQQETPLLSDITASSTFGIDGVVEINTPDVNPSYGLVNLPTQPIDTEVVQACIPGGSQQQSEFTVTGRGGLPPTPREALGIDIAELDWVTLNPKVDNRPRAATPTSQTREAPVRIVEAQGWVFGNNGQVTLTAHAPTATPHRSWQTLTNCHAAQSSPEP